MHLLLRNNLFHSRKLFSGYQVPIWNILTAKTTKPHQICYLVINIAHIYNIIIKFGLYRVRRQNLDNFMTSYILLSAVTLDSYNYLQPSCWRHALFLMLLCHLIHRWVFIRISEENFREFEVVNSGSFENWNHHLWSFWPPEFTQGAIHDRNR